ncbi:MAG: polyphenol oxidase family protein [Polyangiaceae bacterium]
MRGAAHGLASPLLLGAGFRHAFFTRNGGVSVAPFASLNFASGTGDPPENVRENLARAARALEVPPERVYFLSQVHGTDARRVDGGMDRAAFARLEGDATFALEADLACGVRSADCGTVLVGERGSGAALAIHAGWQGTERGVIASAISELVRALERRSGARGLELVAAIGPHIEACCFEVDVDVASRLSLCSPIGDSAITRAVGVKRFVDLRAILTAQLVAAGVPSDRIDHVRGCTKCDPDRFFSYRRDGKVSGRLLSAIVSRGVHDLP